MIVTDADKLALYDDLVSSLAAEREAHALALREQRRACACMMPDPVMQADEKFYCYRCSFETGARPQMLDPEDYLKRAEQAERDLAEARQVIETVREYCHHRVSSRVAVKVLALLPPEVKK